MRKFLGFFIVFLFGICATLDLLHPGFAVTHDGQDHIARIANFYVNLQQGILVPRWAPNLNWGYGHPILEFLYPLPSYIVSFFHFLNFSFIDSTKLVFGLGMIASGLSMYIFAKKLWGQAAGIVSAVLYMYAPYRFVDLYVRGDIGEHVAFIFIPLVFLGFYLVFQKQTFARLIFTAICLDLLILSHNAIALMIIPLIFFYAIFLVWQSQAKKRLSLYFLVSGIFGLLLSGFFWFPALLEGQYTLRNIVTKGGYITRFVTLSQLLYGPWNYGQTGQFSVQLGIMQWGSFIGGIILAGKLWKKNRQTSIFALGLFAVTCVAVLFMLPVSNILWEHFLILQNFQFPWRFLAIPVFTLSLLGGLCVTYISRKKQTLVVIVICLLILFFSRDYLHAKAYTQKSESFFTGIYDSTTDTGESSPIWSVRFMQQRFSSPLEVISGSTKIQQKKRLVTLHEYTVFSSQTSRLLENTLYFPGWRILVDGKPVSIQFQDPAYRGLMTFVVPSGMHQVVVSYGESKLRLTGDILSIIGLVGVVFLLIRSQTFV